MTHDAFDRGLAATVADFDPLVAYDSGAIGQEFRATHTTRNEERKRHESRRAQLAMDNWKEISSLSESQRIPKAAMRRTCEFETTRVYSQSMITWCVFVLLACMAGVLVALIIQHLNM